ncbi:MAG TPA: 4a-hydroxytetrahydrobiopterin dehydratase [Nitrospiria bacterium]|nr:4a-hydroxytetrahydrobiopterin dehydratase [Nitrospiria bacterium]
MAKLPPEEIKNRLTGLAGWQLADNAIRKQFKFNDFMSAVAFVNRVANAAEAADHHPDIVINYTRVTMSLSTHSAGGITEKDFDLAQKIDLATK